MKANIRHFTLIEILVVVVLISLLVGITVPAYTRIMTGNAVSYGSRLIASQLNMARTEACTKRKNVAVVFLNETGSTVSIDDENGIYNRRAFRACYVDSANEFVKWVPGSKWNLLPKGAFFASSTQSGFVGCTTISNVDDDRSDKIFSDNTSFNNAIVFDTTGRPVVSGSNSPQVVIIEGNCISNNGGSTLADANTDDLITKANAENWGRCRVNLYTGKVKTEMNE